MSRYKITEMFLLNLWGRGLKGFSILNKGKHKSPPFYNIFCTISPLEDKSFFSFPSWSSLCAFKTSFVFRQSRFKYRQSSFKYRQSRFKYRQSRFKYRQSRFKYRQCRFKYRQSSFKYRQSRFKYRQSRFKYRQSSFKYRQSRFKYRQCRFKYRQCRFKYRQSRFKYRQSSFKYRQSRFKYRQSRFKYRQCRFKYRQSRFKYRQSRFKYRPETQILHIFLTHWYQGYSTMARVPKISRDIQYCLNSLFTLSDQPLYIWKICIHTHISDCVGTVYVLPLLPNKCCHKTFFHKSGAVGRSDWVCITGVQARRWASTWRWIKHFTISATNRWPKCPNKNQMSLPFTVRRQFQYSENDNWEFGSTGYFCSHSDFPFCEWAVDTFWQTPLEGNVKCLHTELKISSLVTNICTVINP